MASRLSKFRPRILVSNIAVFIFLSVSSSGEEATRCYWCGPLAEQVHRSQRAPSCDIFDLEQHETVCDKGYTHCAIIAASPPYAESRLCVKFYQDECYSLYCNSTKTWRMVCACRGDLCNGPHTERETEAFLLVPKFHSKTKPRNKRSLITGFVSVKTRTPSMNNTIIIIGNKGYNDTANILQSDQPSESENTTHSETTPKHIEENTIIEHGSFKNLDKSITHTFPSKDQSYEESKAHNGPPTMPPMEDKHLEIPKLDKHFNNTKMNKHFDNAEMNKHVGNDKIDTRLNNTETEKGVDNANMDKHIDNSEKDKAEANTDTHLNDTDLDNHVGHFSVDKHLDNVKTGDDLDTPKLDKPTSILEYTTPAESVKESGPITTFASIKPTSIEIEVAVVHGSVTPGKLPPAEALQQNVTPTKAMDVTTIGTVFMSTENHMIESTLPSEIDIKKNGGAQNVPHLLILFTSLLYFYV